MVKGTLQRFLKIDKYNFNSQKETSDGHILLQPKRIYIHRGVNDLDLVLKTAAHARHDIRNVTGKTGEKSVKYLQSKVPVQHLGEEFA